MGGTVHVAYGGACGRRIRFPSARGAAHGKVRLYAPVHSTLDEVQAAPIRRAGSMDNCHKGCIDASHARSSRVSRDWRSIHEKVRWHWRPFLASPRELLRFVAEGW